MMIFIENRKGDDVKKWLKQKLIVFLGVDSLEKSLRQENKELWSMLGHLESLNEKVIKENNSLMEQFNISADINQYEDHSWAVISIQGKPEYVRFVNLSNQDVRSVHDFLKQFERANRTVDSPLMFLEY